jgi:diguanylate cyclase (GGDEF)-like protein/PAS domain S-box-containing protein
MASWFYQQSHVDINLYQHKISKVVDAEHLSERLIQHGFMVNGGEAKNFDEIGTLENQLEKHIPTLNYVDSIHTKKLINSLRELLTNIEQIKRYRTEYKSSLLFFPNSRKRIVSFLSPYTDGGLIHQLNEYERQVILFLYTTKSSHDHQQKVLIEKSSRIKQLMSPLSDEKKEDIQLLIDHGNNLIDLSNRLSVLNQFLSNTEINSISSDVIADLNTRLNVDVEKASRIKQWFYVTILSLISFSAFIWYRQTKYLRQLKANAEELRLAASVFQQTHDGILITDKEQNIVDVNPAFSDITFYKRSEVIGKKPSFLSSGKHDESFYKEMWRSLKDQDFWKGEVWNRNKYGQFYAQLVTISAIRNTKGQLVNYIGIFADITETKKQHEKLDMMAHYDVLTKLPNRSLFADRFQQAISHSKRTGELLAVCFLDLDGFKPINDTYGHEMGDQLLVQVASRLKQCVRESDTISRQGGDEFALLLNNVSSINECGTSLDRVHKAISEPFIIDGFSIKVGVSTGVTIYPTDDSDVDTLLRHADHAMYLAKQAGRNRYHIFDCDQDTLQEQKYAELNTIERALENNEFELYYQPKLNMLTGDITGVEALIRWNHPEKGLLGPGQFLPVLNDTDMEITVGNWVIDSALKQMQAWEDSGLHLEVSVNVSSNHLLSKGFANYLSSALDKYPLVDSQYFQLEILESSALGDISEVREILRVCIHDLGVQVALDDFGTGYSSLTHVRNLPVNTIKIDRSFVNDMIDDVNDYVIIDSVITLAKSFGRSVIAEGVETTEQGIMLILNGCLMAQGYVISKPLPHSELVSWIQSYQLPAAWSSIAEQQLTDSAKEQVLFSLVTESWQRIYTKKYSKLKQA